MPLSCAICDIELGGSCTSCNAEVCEKCIRTCSFCGEDYCSQCYGDNIDKCLACMDEDGDTEEDD